MFFFTGGEMIGKRQCNAVWSINLFSSVAVHSPRAADDLTSLCILVISAYIRNKVSHMLIKALWCFLFSVSIKVLLKLENEIFLDRFRREVAGRLRKGSWERYADVNDKYFSNCSFFLQKNLPKTPVWKVFRGSAQRRRAVVFAGPI